MATYTARKVNPRIENGLFMVDVEILKDGEVVRTERFETPQAMPDNWPAEAVKNLIRRMQGLPEMLTKVPAGDVTLPPDPVIDQAKAAWQADFRRFQTAYMLVQAGVILETNLKYIALKNRLKNNAKPEYLDLG